MILAIPLLLVWLILSVTMIAVIAHTRLKLWEQGEALQGIICVICCVVFAPILFLAMGIEVFWNDRWW